MASTNGCLAPVTFVFPGQGSQRAGMGRDFHDRFPSSRRAYEEASDSAGFDVAAVCFGDDARLGLTEYSQCAILTTEIAMLRGLGEEWGLEAGRFAGHSLGENTALVAAGVIPLASAAHIVRERGRLMQQAVPVGEGAMIALLGERVEHDAVASVIGDLRVSIANDNSDAQIVLSGPVADVRRAAERVVAQASTGAARSVELDVSAPFHSWMMAVIEDEFASVLADASGCWDVSRADRVTSNLTGAFHTAEERLVRERLVGQLSGTVRWRANMLALTSSASAILEVGPSRPLRAFFRSIDVDVTSIVDLRSAERAFATRPAVAA
jgi:[acyl-carrier-protein] S-malonyltransferase